MKVRRRRRAQPAAHALIRSIARLRMEPGDVLVLSAPDAPPSARLDLHRFVHRVARDLNVPVVLLSDGLRASVLSGAAAAKIPLSQGDSSGPDHHPV